MADTNPYIPIDDVVYSYLNWKNIAGTGDLDRFKQVIIEGFTDLNIFHTDYYKSVTLVVNEANQTKLPADYIDWLIVYIVYQGEIFELDKNDSIHVQPLDVCATAVTIPEHLMPVSYKGYKYTATRRNPFGQFKIDKEQRIIQFSGIVQTEEIILIYKGTGVPDYGTVFVPRELKTVLRNYLDWQLKEADDMVPGAIKYRAEQMYGNSLLLYYKNKDQLSAKELLDLFRNSMQQGIKS